MFLRDIFQICCGYLALLLSEMLFHHMDDTDVFGVFTVRDWSDPERPNTDHTLSYCGLKLTSVAVSVLAAYSVTLCLSNQAIEGVERVMLHSQKHKAERSI